MAKKILSIASALAVSLVGSAVFAAAPPSISVSTTPTSVTIGSAPNQLTINLKDDDVVLNSSVTQLNPGTTTNDAVSPGVKMPEASDPALTSEPEGTLTITATPGGYDALWDWSGLVAGQQVLLVGDAGSSISLGGPSETTVLTTVSTAGTVTFFIPSSDYFASPTSPETFAAFALFSSAPVGQMPEVPLAAGLPLAALGGVAGLLLWKRRQGSLS